MALKPETVDVTVGETTYTLVPNLSAATAIAASLNGPLAALDGLRGLNIITITSVVAAGASLGRKEAEGLAEAIYNSGKMTEIAGDCVEFCMLLMNGGKRDEPKEAAGKKSEAAKS